MNRWTIEELNNLDSYDFAKAILHERRAKVIPYSPLGVKLSESRVEVLAAAERERMIFDCESSDCAYNHGGECRFARVHESAPTVTEGQGCRNFVLQ